VRAELIRQGRMDRDGQMHLSERVDKFGSCTDMCPEFERVRRIVENDVKAPECTKKTAKGPRKDRVPDESRMVKAFQRSAAGMETELMTDVRTPETCLKTMKYMIQRLDEDGMEFLNSWIWDRSRAVRKDLGLVSIKRKDVPAQTECLELCARFHMVSMQQMARNTLADYDRNNDAEQLSNVYTSLTHRWEDSKKAGIDTPNLTEFLAYRILLSIQFTTYHGEDTIFEYALQDARVKIAKEIREVAGLALSAHTQTITGKIQNWVRFWDLVQSPKVSYLMACAAAFSFNRVRHHILDTLRRVYRPIHSNHPAPNGEWSLQKLVEVLGFDEENQVTEFCEQYGASFWTDPQGVQYLDLNSFRPGRLQEPPTIKPQYFSQRIVEKKRGGRSLSAILLGMSVREAKSNGLMESGYESQAQFSKKTAAVGNVISGDSLFIPESTPRSSINSDTPFATQQPTRGSLSSPQPDPFSNYFKPTSGLPTSTSAGSSGANPFLTSVPQLSPFSGTPATTIQPGLFDVARNTIKFSSTSSAPSLFSTSNGGSSSSFAPAPTTSNPFANAASVLASTKAIGSSATATAFDNGNQFQRSLPPVTVPDPEAERREAEEKRRKADEERRRLVEEQERLVREAQKEQERQAYQAEQKRAQEAERQRLLRQKLAEEAEQRRQAEEQQRLAQQEAARKERLRSEAFQGLAMNLMTHEKGIMVWKLQNLISKTIYDAQAALEAEQQARNDDLADRMFYQRRLASVRKMCFKWVQVVQKKKKRAEDRRRRQKRRAFRDRAEAATENSAVDTSPAVETSWTAKPGINQPPHSLANGLTDSTTNGPSSPRVPFNMRRDRQPLPPKNRTQTKPTGEEITSKFKPRSKAKQPNKNVDLSVHASPPNTNTSNSDYSQAYYKSKAPIDRTETDWFRLRAMGIDPSKHRKRSFGSISSDSEEQPDIEIKRIRHSTESAVRPSLPPPATDDERIARFRAIQQAFKQSPVVTSTEARRSVNGRSSLIIAQARELIADTPLSHRSPSSLEDQRHSVFSNGLPQSRPHQSTFGRSIGAPLPDERPAYWKRQSAFVPQHLYGKGPEVIQAYRDELLGRSAAGNEPLQLSSPLPTQLSYIPSNNIQHSQSEPLEAEFEDDADDESQTYQESDDVDEDEEGVEEDTEKDIEEDDGVDYDEYDEYGNSEEGGDMPCEQEEYGFEEAEGEECMSSFQHFAQKPGATQDDAIELSD